MVISPMIVMVDTARFRDGCTALFWRGGAPPCGGCGALSLWVPCPFVASTVPCRQHTDCAMGALHTIAMTIQSPTLQNPYFFSFWLCKLPAGLRLEIPAREPFSPPSPPALSSADSDGMQASVLGAPSFDGGNYSSAGANTLLKDHFVRWARCTQLQ